MWDNNINGFQQPDDYVGGDENEIVNLEIQHEELWRKLNELKDMSYQADKIDDAAQTLYTYSVRPHDASEAIEIWSILSEQAPTDAVCCCLICVVDCTLKLIIPKLRSNNSMSSQLIFLHLLLPKVGLTFSRLRDQGYWTSILTAKKMLSSWRMSMMIETPLLHQLSLCLTGLPRQRPGALVELKRICDEETIQHYPMHRYLQDEKEKRDLKKALRGMHQIKDLNHPSFEAEWLANSVRHMPSLIPEWSKTLKDKEGNIGIASVFWEGESEEYWNSFVLDSISLPEDDSGRLKDDEICCK